MWWCTCFCRYTTYYFFLLHVAVLYFSVKKFILWQMLQFSHVFFILGSCLLDDEAFIVLSTLTDLKRIYLHRCLAVQGTSLFMCNKVEVLSLSLCTKVKDESVVKLLHHTDTLRQLTLFDTGITSSCLFRADMIIQAMDGRESLTIYTNLPQYVPFDGTPPLIIKRCFSPFRDRIWILVSQRAS